MPGARTAHEAASASAMLRKTCITLDLLLEGQLQLCRRDTELFRRLRRAAGHGIDDRRRTEADVAVVADRVVEEVRSAAREQRVLTERAAEIGIRVPVRRTAERVVIADVMFLSPQFPR